MDYKLILVFVLAVCGVRVMEAIHCFCKREWTTVVIIVEFVKIIIVIIIIVIFVICFKFYFICYNCKKWKMWCICIRNRDIVFVSNGRRRRDLDETLALEAEHFAEWTLRSKKRAHEE